MKLHLIIYSLLFSLSGCRYVEWGKNVFYQSKIQFTYAGLRNDYIRTLRIYDQFTTLGLFDILWLSAEVRTLYSQEYAALYGYSPAVYEEFLQEQLEENDEFISFYVLASIPHPQDVLLTDDETPWTVYLSVDGVDYEPEVLDVDDLTYPYQVFFGRRYTIAKTVYQISFAAKTESGEPIITPLTRSFSLCFHRAGRVDECVCWKLKNPREASACCINNPDILAYDIK